MYCPNCGKEVGDESKFCRYCGAKVEGGGIDAKQKQAQQILATMPSYDNPRMIPRDMLKENERIIFEKHPHKVFTLLGAWILGAILALSGVGLFFDSDFIGIGIIMEIFAFLLFFISYLSWKYTVYGLTTYRVMRLKGIIGKDFYEAPLERIQDLRLKMGVLQRIFGCGNIMITTAGTALIECAWKNIEKPREALKTLRTLLGR